ncbi:MAG: bifunctional phosphopantothenoylcysteine decarboxylase/phosphopantothenate--cysteine ligase CoaBC [Leptolyngbyaceae cyanobacterium T60_A2020_046]|nr:bifunctional phosphopantothenoylcysteine decarboxylase/phosphopantothenate--cysteine ligase CoaBC [Leptolyngbyaceae cyanobacterium T60_A2020_046]
MTAGELSRSPHVLLGVGGGIAAYKVCDVVSTLAKAGVEVRAVLTDGAQRFVTPLTFATLCRHPAYTDEAFRQGDRGRPLHIELGEWADLMVLAPLTANTLAKLAYGLADNLLTNTVLASTCPLLVAPAMNTEMWEQRSVQRNWAQVQADPRVHAVGPGAGRLACDRVGLGRMAEPVELLVMIESLLWTRGRRDLVGKSVLVSGGSTQEYLDPVRFIGNPSTGKMGVALALAAAHRGAQVTLVHGPMTAAVLAPLATAPIATVPVTTAAEMQAALEAALPQVDWLVMAAAVADVKPRDRAATKLPKAALPERLPLAPVPDIVAHLSRLKQPHQRLIGFAAQTGEIVPPALQKLTAKGLDAIVANPIDQAEGGFGSDRNQAVLLCRDRPPYPIPLCSKQTMAHHIYDGVQALWALDSAVGPSLA